MEDPRTLKRQRLAATLRRAMIRGAVVGTLVAMPPHLMNAFQIELTPGPISTHLFSLFMWMLYPDRSGAHALGITDHASAWVWCAVDVFVYASVGLVLAVAVAYVAKRVKGVHRV